MENLDDNEIKIANYFDGKMNSFEQQEFMKTLGENVELRKQYEDELLLRGLFNTDEEVLLTDAKVPGLNINSLTNVPAYNMADGKKQEPLSFIIFKSFRKVAAILLIVIASAIIIFLVTNQRKSAIVPKTNLAKNDSVKPHVGENNNNLVVREKNISSENIFKKYYKNYSAKSDPVEISNFYSAYRNHKYDNVITAQKEDYQAMGVNDKSDLLKEYMHLYKGLSYLELNKTDLAKQQFDSVLQSANKTSNQYFQVQWYTLLLLVKTNEIIKAREIASLIVHSSSPFKNKAATILTDLADRK